MFTDDDPAHYVASYCRLLGVPSVTNEPFHEVNRADWIAAGGDHQNHLFVDPDIGLCFNQHPPDHPERYLMPEELVNVVGARPDKLTLVHDQSYDAGLPVIDLIYDKLQWLADRDVHGLAYNPPQPRASRFFLVAMNPNILAYATGLLNLANLPEHRLIQI